MQKVETSQAPHKVVDPLDPPMLHIPIAILCMLEDDILTENDIISTFGDHIKVCEQCRSALEYIKQLKARREGT